MKAEGLAAVTGAGQGIGLAVSAELARRGFDVLALVFSADQIGAVRDAVLPGKVECRVLDVTAPGDFAFPEGLRVLVNNAGIRLKTLPVEHTALDEFRRIMEVNFFGSVEMARRAIPGMRAAGSGVICNISSGSLLFPIPFLSAYRASKGAVSAFSETLRIELAPLGIRVIEVMPGATLTGMSADSPSRNPADAVKFPPYAPMAEAMFRVNSASYKDPTPAADAARAIVDAILDDAAPMRHGTDAASTQGLRAWREQTDEAIYASAARAFGA
jgi:NAD(P)-dependent dehydrogenase (short-subunit alcohol dehydrogenase family)